MLVSEFSELEGPVPLFVIPENCAVDNQFINEFVLRIMAVDYQQSNKHSSDISGE